MPQNIKNNNIEKIRLALNYDSYFDFMLYKGEVKPAFTSLDKIASFDFNKDKFINGHFYSSIIWDQAVNNNIILNNFGLTGVDNGQITYRKDRISNQEFYDIFTKSKLDLSNGDRRFFLTPVSGNTLDYVYDSNLEDEYISLKGGFLQGFFKVFERDYQVLPDKIDDTWEFSIRLRPRTDYAEKDDSLNFYIPENKGMFLYIGTRAENKFWPYYKSDEEKMKEFFDKGCIDTDYSIDYDYNQNSVVSQPYIVEDPNPPIPDDYSQDDYFGGNYRPECEDKPYNETEYFGEDLDLSEADLETDDGRKIYEKKGARFTTDNKFLLFNNTPTGYTTNNWEEGTEVEFEQGIDLSHINLFEYMNNTPTGYTTDSVNKLADDHRFAYKILKDLYGNALGFKINNDGSIEYRYLVLNCENEPNHYEIKIGKSKPGIIKMDEWNNIAVRLEKAGETGMVIFVYVNGLLKFISKELPLLNLRGLDDSAEKQETVPYNISVGGGSQGLAEVIYLDYYNISEYTLPIEKYFGGSFIGDISNFSLSI